MPAKPAKLSPPSTTGGSLPRTIAEWAFTLLVLVFTTSTLAQPFVIPTGSMEDNLMVGDHLIVDKLAYAPGGPISRHLLPYLAVKRGDIIVFRFPLNIQENYVKRVIGMPGDRIRLVDKDVYLNGKKLNEPYTFHKTPYLDTYRDNFPNAPAVRLPRQALEMLEKHLVNGEVVVPPGNYFALGDNRDNSSDSRYWGFVPKENVIGKPLVVYWSFDAPTEHLADRNIMSWDHFTDLAANFFSKTRWNRTFLLIHGYPLHDD